jgi:hypothetical protein
MAHGSLHDAERSRAGSQRRQGAGAALVVMQLLACFPSSPDFPPARQPRGVRVLGTLSEPASGTPGGTLQLSLEAFDGAPLLAQALAAAGVVVPGEEGASTVDPAPLRIAWLGGCHNPSGDTQAGCYPLLGEIARALPDPLPSSNDAIPGELSPYFGVGNGFSVSVPSDILAGRQLMTDAPPFGVSFTFFAVCRGVLRPAPEVTNGVPLRCHDAETDEPLGSEAWVPGYITTYTYPGLVNQSPALLGASIDGAELPELLCESDADCAELSVGALPTACARPVKAELEPATEPAPLRCLPLVTSCTPPPCESHELSLALAPSSVEKDPAATPPGGVAPDEILWVKYFGYGGFSREEALVNDRETGLNPDYALRWTPPSVAIENPVPIWAIVQDNRGGTAMARWDFVVRP